MFRWFTYGVRVCAGNLLAGVFFVSGVSAQERVDVLAFGDSLTQGYGLLEQDGFVPQLRSWLEARGHDVRLVNGGVSGDTTAGGLARVEWSLTNDIDAMIVALGGNDLLRGIDPALARSNVEGILKIAEAKDVEVLLVGMQAPGNYGPEYKAAFDAIYPDLAEAYGTLYFPSFFEGLTAGDAVSPADVGDVMQGDGIHPNEAGVRLIVEAMGPAVEALIAQASTGQ